MIAVLEAITSDVTRVHLRRWSSKCYHLRSTLLRARARCTLINMFGIVWSLVEILSRAAGSRPLPRPLRLSLASLMFRDHRLAIARCDEIAR